MSQQVCGMLDPTVQTGASSSAELSSLPRTSRANTMASSSGVNLSSTKRHLNSPDVAAACVRACVRARVRARARAGAGAGAGS